MSSSKITPSQQLIMLLGITLCCMFIGQALGKLLLLLCYPNLAELTDQEINSFVVLARLGVIHVFAHLLAFFVFLRVTNLKFGELFPAARLKPIYLSLLPLVAVFCIVTAGLLATWSLQFFEANGFSEIVQQEYLNQQALLPLLTHNNPLQLIVSLVVLAVLPAVGEEFIYRGILQNQLLASTHNRHFSVLIGALIFSAMHLQPVNLAAIFLMGAVLGYIYLFTKSIWYGVILHFLINAFQVMQCYFYPEAS